ncbi:MAG: universal stress protein [Nitrospira sp.]|jgi:nucleotide-binding universal stress UspA family protein|nr:universal stress protein [Nitrospira sp. BO4]
MRILVAVDESENALHAVRYVGSLLRQTPDVIVTLFHVLKPIPRGLLEHGGSENPHMEEVLSDRLREEREAWLRQEKEAECPILERACETLIRAGFDKSRVALKFGHEDDIATTILEETRKGHHDTIVVGRTGTTGITRIFGGGITDHLLRDAQDVAIWIITRP